MKTLKFKTILLVVLLWLVHSLANAQLLGVVASNHSISENPYVEPDLENFTYTNNSIDVSSTVSGTNRHLKLWENKLYTGNDTSIYQYSRDITDVSNSSYDSKTYSMGSTHRASSVSSDGSHLIYVSTSDIVRRANLSTPGDMSTGVNQNDTKTFTNSGSYLDVTMDRDNGNYLYLLDRNGNSCIVYQFNYSTSWDNSTLTYSNNSFDLNASESSNGIWISKTGKTLFAVYADINGKLKQFNLTTPWDISTATYVKEISNLGGFYAISVCVDDVNNIIYLSDSSGLIRQYSY